MKVQCPSCDIEYTIKSQDAEDDGIEALYCPCCGFETKGDLDLSNDATQLGFYDEDDDDWDNWHPDDRF